MSMFQIIAILISIVMNILLSMMRVNDANDGFVMMGAPCCQDVAKILGMHIPAPRL